MYINFSLLSIVLYSSPSIVSRPGGTRVYLQTTLDKLFDRDNAVLVEIEFLEDPVQLLPRLPLLLGVMSLSHQLVHRCHDFAQLAPGDTAVPVYIVQLEGPSQFFINAAPQQGR